MASMDTTHDTGSGMVDPVHRLLETLTGVDPAAAPDVAEQLAAKLSAELDDPENAGAGHN